MVTVAEKWLRKEKHCHSVLVESRRLRWSRTVSFEEPDAIGWVKWDSIVVECKASMHDLERDKRKWGCLIHPDPKRPPIKLQKAKLDFRQALERMGYSVGEIEKMGRFRYILCPDGLVSLSALEEHAPQHGLLYFDGEKILTVKEAPRRSRINREAEAALLRGSARCLYTKSPT